MLWLTADIAGPTRKQPSVALSLVVQATGQVVMLVGLVMTLSLRAVDLFQGLGLQKGFCQH